MATFYAELDMFGQEHYCYGQLYVWQDAETKEWFTIRFDSVQKAISRFCMYRWR